MATERLAQEEDKSLWKSRLFKMGVVFVAVGLLLGSPAVLAMGSIAMGGAWATKRGK